MNNVQNFNTSFTDAIENEVVANDAAAHACMFVTRNKLKAARYVRQTFASLPELANEAYGPLRTVLGNPSGNAVKIFQRLP